MDNRTAGRGNESRYRLCGSLSTLRVSEEPEFNLGSHGTLGHTRHLFTPILNRLIRNAVLGSPRPECPKLLKNVPERRVATAQGFSAPPEFP